MFFDSPSTACFAIRFYSSQPSKKARVTINDLKKKYITKAPILMSTAYDRMSIIQESTNDDKATYEYEYCLLVVSFWVEGWRGLSFFCCFYRFESNQVPASLRQAGWISCLLVTPLVWPCLDLLVPKYVPVALCLKFMIWPHFSLVSLILSGMVLLGHDTTVPVTMDQMVSHIAAVNRSFEGSQRPFLLGDPCCSFPTVAYDRFTEQIATS
jgi:hypothetical protein